MADTAETLRENVRRILERNQITGKELASRAGMAPSQLSNYLTGKIEPSLSVVSRIATALDTTPAELLADPQASGLPPRLQAIVAQLPFLDPDQLGYVESILERAAKVRAEKAIKAKKSERKPG